MISALMAIMMLTAAPQIQGEINVDQYKLVQLSVANAPQDAAVLWDIYPEEPVDIKELSDGTLIFTGPPGVYKIKMRLISGRQVDTFRSMVTIKGIPAPNPTPNPGPGPTPNPGPNPNPNPDPAPVLPDGKYKLASKAAEWAKSVNSFNRVSEASALGGAFSGCTAAAAAGTIPDLTSLLNLSRDSNRQALGTAADAWKPWFTNLKAELDTLYSAGTLKTLDDHVTAFSEIALGLRSVK